MHTYTYTHTYNKLPSDYITNSYETLLPALHQRTLIINNQYIFKS